MSKSEEDKFTQPIEHIEITYKSDSLLTVGEIFDVEQRIENGEDRESIILEYAIEHALNQEKEEARSAAEYGWHETLEGGITKTFVFPNRRATSQFIETLMAYANEVNHHPNIETMNESVMVTFKTRAVDSVTQLDHKCAEFADKAAESALKVQ